MVLFFSRKLFCDKTLFSCIYGQTMSHFLSTVYCGPQQTWRCVRVQVFKTHGNAQMHRVTCIEKIGVPAKKQYIDGDT